MWDYMTYNVIIMEGTGPSNGHRVICPTTKSEIRLTYRVARRLWGESWLPGGQGGWRVRSTRGSGTTRRRGRGGLQTAVPAKWKWKSWWRHQMETFSALLAICAGNSPLTGDSPHKGQWRGAFVFSFICAWINGWVNNVEAGDLRRHLAHYDVIAMYFTTIKEKLIEI